MDHSRIDCPDFGTLIVQRNRKISICPILLEKNLPQSKINNQYYILEGNSYFTQCSLINMYDDEHVQYRLDRKIWVH